VYGINNPLRRNTASEQAPDSSPRPGDYALFSLESRAAARALAQRLTQGPRRYFGVNLINIGTDIPDETLWVEMPADTSPYWGQVMDPREVEKNNRLVREKHRLRSERRAQEQRALAQEKKLLALPAGEQVQ
jgi:hypothetical protein